MKSQLQDHANHVSRWGASLIPLALLVFAFASAAHATSYRPTISPIPNQTFTTNPAASTFVVRDYDTADSSTLLVSVAFTSRRTWTSDPQYLVTTNANDPRIRSLTFPMANFPTGAGSITAIVTVQDAAGLNNSTAFTLQRYAAGGGNTPPSLGSFPDKTIKAGTGYLYQIARQNDIAVTCSAVSNNLSVVSTVSCSGPSTSDGIVTSLTASTTSTSGTATVTMTLTVTANAYATTAFVIDTVSEDPPVLTFPVLFQAKEKVGFSTPFSFHIAAGTQSLSNVVFSATSSNPDIVPNDLPTSSNVAFSFNPTTGDGTIAVSPVSNQVGAATITITATDGLFPAKAQFLYVVKDSTQPYMQIARSRGIFVVDGPGVTYPSPLLGYDIDLRASNIVSKPYVNGYLLRVPWTSVEQTNWNGIGNAVYDFKMIDHLLNILPPGQKLSLLFVGEPAYILDHTTNTWCEANTPPQTGCTTRPVPYDSYLLTRWQALIAAMAAHHVIDENGITTADTIASHPKLGILNSGLPGAKSIRDPDKVPGPILIDLDHDGVYTPRATLVSAIETYLSTMQTNFPGKPVQVGFWSLAPDGIMNISLTDYVRTQLLGYFDGQTRPLVGFWQENLAANRGTVKFDYLNLVANGSGYANIAPYNYFPQTSFATPLRDSKTETWNGFQMLGSWKYALNQAQMPKTQDGSPSDAMEAAYNNYFSQYFEVYHGDFTPYADELQRWHDYLGSLAP